MSFNAFSAFTPNTSVLLTSTTVSQTTVVPAGNDDLLLFNGGTNPVYMAWGAIAAVPAAGVWTNGVLTVLPGMIMKFGSPIAGGNLSYIAVTAGGALTISAGIGA
jgi:hypothetical protein